MNHIIVIYWYIFFSSEKKIREPLFFVQGSEWVFHQLFWALSSASLLLLHRIHSVWISSVESWPMAPLPTQLLAFVKLLSVPRTLKECVFPSPLNLLFSYGERTSGMDSTSSLRSTVLFHWFEGATLCGSGRTVFIPFRYFPLPCLSGGHCRNANPRSLCLFCGILEQFGKLSICSQIGQSIHYFLNNTIWHGQVSSLVLQCIRGKCSNIKNWCGYRKAQ